MNFFDFFKRKKRGQRSVKELTDDEYGQLRADRRKEVDRILDKISQKGYKRLTKKEIDFLNENKDRL